MINKLNIQIPIIASACPIEVTKDLNLLGMVITKSVTLEAQQGNPESYIEYDSGMTLNNMGLPNLGIKDFIKITMPKYLTTLTQGVHLVVSVYAKTIYELDSVIQELDKVKHSFYGIELNLSCPNVGIGGFTMFETVGLVNTLHSHYKDKFISLKLAPSVTDTYLERLLSDTDIRWLNCFNTTPASSVCYGLSGGLGGKPIKDLYVQRIKNIKDKYPDFNVIATGGIESAEDIKDYLSVGADLCAVGSYFLKNKTNIRELVTNYATKYMNEEQ